MTLQRLQRNTIALSAVLGLLGVFSGYALFVLVREQLQGGHGTTFLLAVLVAGVMSFAIEWVRDIIRHGHEEPLRLSRVVVTIFTLMMFEIFVIALHEIPSWHLAEVSALPHQLLGTDANSGGHPLQNLLLLAAIWFVAGAVLAGTLSWAIFASHRKQELSRALRQQVLDSARRGIGGGAISAPIAALLAVLLLRVLIIARLYFFAHGQWRDSMHALVGTSAGWGTNPFSAMTRAALMLFLWIDSLWGGWAIGPLLTVGVYVAALVLLSKAKDNVWPFGVLLLAGVVVFFQPLVHDLKALLAIPLLGALVWAIPGLVLGLLSPLLRRPSELPREWGILALVAAGVLLIATWARFDWWWIFPTVLLTVAIVYFRNGVSVEEYWPFVALSVAIIVAGATSLMQYVSFAGVLRQLHEINSLPAYVIDAPPEETSVPIWKLLPNNNLLNPPIFPSKLINGRSPLLDWNNPLLSKPTTRNWFAPPPTTNDLFSTLLSRSSDATTQPTISSSANFGLAKALADSGLQRRSLTTQPANSAWLTDKLFRQAAPTYSSEHSASQSEPALEQKTPPVSASEGEPTEAAGHPHASTLEAEQNAEHGEGKTQDAELTPPETARLLEICLSSAFAFWCTVAMLASWAVLRSFEQHGEIGEANSGAIQNTD